MIVSVPAKRRKRSHISSGIQNSSFLEEIPDIPVKPRFIPETFLNRMQNLGEICSRPPMALVENLDGNYFISLRRSKSLNSQVRLRFFM